MKKNTHPSYQEVTVTCSCGSSFETRSTLGQPTLSVEICAKCHPFFTRKQKVITSGRIDRFKQKYGAHSIKPLDAPNPETRA